MSEQWERWQGYIVDGRFPLQRYLGAGADSAVFLTETGDREPHPAAIKMVPSAAVDSRRQLSRWARASKLSHPNLLSLIYFGACELDGVGMLYAVMEYAAEDMAKVLAERSLSEAETGEMLPPVLSALVYLHGEGLVHGHVKPSNVMAVGEQVKVSSDGICSIGEAGGTTPNPGPYDAPEFREHASSAADVWSLGMTLGEALTQRLPDPGGRSLAIHGSFRHLVTACLQSDPRRRPSVSQIENGLETPPPPAVEIPVRTERPSTRLPAAKKAHPRYLVPVVAATGIALAAVLIVPRLTREQIIPEPPAVSSAPAPYGVLPNAAVPSASPRRKIESRDREAPSAAALPPLGSGRSGNSAPGEVLRRVMPDVPQKARRSIRGKVKVGVRVDVDASGKVRSSRLESAGPSRYFAGLALQAARGWTFRPPKVQGQNVSSQWLLRFELTRSASDVRASPVVSERRRRR